MGATAALTSRFGTTAGSGQTQLMRLLIPAVFGAALVAVWVYALLDVIATERALVRRLAKPTWLVVVALFVGFGALAWLALGRPRNAGWFPGDTSVRQPRRFVGPEDRDDWVPPLLPNSPNPEHPAGAGRRRAAKETAQSWEQRVTQWQADLEGNDGDD